MVIQESLENRAEVGAVLMYHGKRFARTRRVSVVIGSLFAVPAEFGQYLRPEQRVEIRT